MAAGAALAFKLRKEPRIAVCLLRRRRFVEDRLLRRGRIPPARTRCPGAVRDQQRLGDLGAAFGADGRRDARRRRASPAACTACRSDGNDLIAGARKAMRRAVERARNGEAAA
jgi:hypothetical protein